MRVVLPVLLAAACWAPVTAADYCGPGAVIPNNAPSGALSQIEIPCDDPTVIEDLDVGIEVWHTWMGDLSATLSKQGGQQAVVLDRPGYAGTGFGCPGNDMDAILDDEAATPVESACDSSQVPSIQGRFIPGDPPGPLMARFDGLELCGTWELRMVDHTSGDSGSLTGWCLYPNSDDDPAVPATTDVGAVLTVLALLCFSAYLLRRRSQRRGS